ncbi:hypothetical protein GQ42DRAFT_87320 [Ramicandelaber brevisporus]|nr:hypothetical protein GQ42DRAFT_87320 [Ramicandelaber brevisporus]
MAAALSGIAAVSRLDIVNEMHSNCKLVILATSLALGVALWLRDVIHLTGADGLERHDVSAVERAVQLRARLLVLGLKHVACPRLHIAHKERQHLLEQRVRVVLCIIVCTATIVGLAGLNNAHDTVETDVAFSLALWRISSALSQDCVVHRMEHFLPVEALVSLVSVASLVSLEHQGGWIRACKQRGNALQSENGRNDGCDNVHCDM